MVSNHLNNLTSKLPTGHIYTETISSMPMFKGMPAAALTDMALALEHVQVHFTSLLGYWLGFVELGWGLLESPQNVAERSSRRALNFKYSVGLN